MLAVEKDIAQKQAQLVDLNKQQVALSQQAIDVATQQLAVQKQQLVFSQISSVQLQLQTQMQEENKLQRRRQKELKEAAYANKQQVISINKENDLLVRYAMLLVQKQEVDFVGLTPNELEEIGDKEYVRESLDFHNASIADARIGYTEDKKQGISSFYAINRIQSTVSNLRRQIEGFKNEIRTLQATISNLELSLEESPKLNWKETIIKKPFSSIFVAFLTLTCLAGIVKLEFSVSIVYGIILALFIYFRYFFKLAGNKSREKDEIQSNIASNQNEIQSIEAKIQKNENDIQALEQGLSEHEIIVNELNSNHPTLFEVLANNPQLENQLG